MFHLRSKKIYFRIVLKNPPYQQHHLSIKKQVIPFSLHMLDKEGTVQSDCPSRTVVVIQAITVNGMNPGKSRKLTLLHSDRPKLYTILAFLSAIRLTEL